MRSAEDIFETLIAPVEERLISTISRIVRDGQADDVLQETLAVVWTKLRRIHRHPNPHAYIMRIAISRSYDALRKRKRRKEVPLYSAVDVPTIADATDLSDDVDRLSHIREAVAELPPHQAQAVLLRAFEGASYEEIADVIGCKAATARSHFSRGRARLERILIRLGVIRCPGVKS